MKAVLQRVTRAQVTVDDRVTGAIGPGLCVLVGAVKGDTEVDADFIAKKLATVRVFHDDEGKMNRSVLDTGGKLLVVSQFTLAAETTSGTRPSFSNALPPTQAEPLIEYLVGRLEERGLSVEQGEFGALMSVELCNQGPVTIILDSKNKVRK